MNKKTLIIVTTAIIVLALAGAAFFAYQKNLLAPLFKEFTLSLSKGGLGGIFNKSSEAVLTPENLLASFEIKNQNLTPEVADIFKQRFSEVKEVLQKNPDSFNDWLYLGVLKKGVGDYEGARDAFIYVGQIRPKSSTPFANLADIYANFLDEPQKGLEAIKTAIANDPNDYNFYSTMADIYRYRLPGQEAMYETTMLEALQKFPNNPNLVGPLALYYKQTSQTQKAIEYYEKLVKISPENQMAKEDLAELKQANNSQ